MAFYFEIDFSEWIDEMKRVENLPTPQARSELEATLEAAFLESQAAVHVKTGQLKLNTT